MTKLSPKIRFFILISTLALIATSRGDDTVVTSAEPTCECPPDLSEQLRTTLTTECDSKLAGSNDDIRHLQTEIDHFQSYNKTFVADTKRDFDERTARSTTECDSRLAVSNGDIDRFRTEINQCRLEHAIYVENVDQDLADAGYKLADAVGQSDRCTENSSVIEDERTTLRSELSSLRVAGVAQTEKYDKFVSTCNDLLSSSQLDNSRCAQEMEGCRSDYKGALERHESLQKENEALQSVRTLLDVSRQEKAECLSDHNSALQKKETLQKDLARIESLAVSKATKTKKEQSKLKAEIERLKKNVKNQQDRYYNERENVNRLEKEMREMRQKTEVMYVNTTLVKQDIAGFTARNLNRAHDAYDTGILKIQQHPLTKLLDTKSRVVYDHMKRLYTRLIKLYVRYCVPIIKRGLAAIKTFYMHYCAPIIQQGLDTIQDTPTWKEYAVPAIEKAAEMRESIFLSIASAVKETSTVGLDYIELTLEGLEANWFVEYIVGSLSYMKNYPGRVTQWIITGTLALIVAPSLVVEALLFLFHAIIFMMLLPFYPFVILRRKISK